MKLPLASMKERCLVVTCCLLALATMLICLRVQIRVLQNSYWRELHDGKVPYSIHAVTIILFTYSLAETRRHLKGVRLLSGVRVFVAIHAICFAILWLIMIPNALKARKADQTDIRYKIPKTMPQ
jgi:hypothetical protein